MPVVSGNLSVVTSAAADVPDVLVRSTRVRPLGGGVIVDDEVLVATPGGKFSATLVAGPAVMLISPDGGSPRAVPILVAASPSTQTLESVVRAAELAKGASRDVLDELAAAVAAQLSNATAEANRAQGYADSINPTSFAKAAHTHAIADVTNLQSTLNDKAATSHTHAIANVTGLQPALNGKSPSVVNTITVETEAAAQALTGLRKGDVVIVTATGNVYKEV